jgi:hypothetical protein
MKIDKNLEHISSIFYMVEKFLRAFYKKVVIPKSRAYLPPRIFLRVEHTYDISQKGEYWGNGTIDALCAS